MDIWSPASDTVAAGCDGQRGGGGAAAFGAAILRVVVFRAAYHMGSGPGVAVARGRMGAAEAVVGMTTSTAVTSCASAPCQPGAALGGGNSSLEVASLGWRGR